MAETSAPSRPYLEGNYAPILAEIDAPDLDVTGEIPRDLEGMFVRNSSNPRFEPKGRYHWFDGDGMLHGVHFQGGKATYRNRWIRTKGFLAEQEAGGPLWTGVTERPDFTNPRGPFKDTANTDIALHGGRLLALWWLGGEPYAIGLPGLETCGTETFGGRVPTMSAHPKVDPVSGELLFFDYKPFPPYLSYGVVLAGGELVHHTTIDLPGPRLQHDMAITERFAIFLDMSMMWDPAKLAQGRTKVGFFRDKPTRFGVLPRRAQGSEIRWFEASPCYIYHTINAWEDGDTIVVLGCKIDDPLVDDPEAPPRRAAVPAIGFLRLEPTLYRWTLELGSGRVREERLDDVLTEFPSMDRRLLGRPSRYSYNPRLAPAPTLLFDGLVKYDHQTGRSWTHAYPRGFYGGEVAFAPRVGARGEDDGYLVTFVVEEATGASELHVLDAANVDRAPIARLRIPQRVPTGYHAAWVPADRLAAR
ncbi:carotenoid oxygenase family protein [Sorangium sp. So ce375]|uniref:carotenoid oxygenase family protein n=1 Tax=Sorangium sp. So ce375 TaxID=3133306 RepID=UPI003F5C4974